MGFVLAPRSATERRAELGDRAVPLVETPISQLVVRSPRLDHLVGEEHEPRRDRMRSIVNEAERREDLARDFVLHMERAVARAATGAASRRAIAVAAAEVVSEAQAEGIDLEVLHLAPAPIHVVGKPRVEDEDAQVFYVHIVMPHLENGVLTRDSYTIDADGGEEFSDYLRNRTLPELRTLVKERNTLKTAA